MALNIFSVDCSGQGALLGDGPVAGGQGRAGESAAQMWI